IHDESEPKFRTKFICDSSYRPSDKALMAMLPLEESQMTLIILLRNKALTMRKYLFGFVA
ncbi:hypothetical protein J7940_24210, partial [Vibrio parahaemolyticus]|nr:hypothetical protein [Vibrio parahaemolyticus]MCF9541064.1 hypothetical protein [Vibrio parahaemolyticus]MCG6528858.1 hypothetical protein [Vibrio parahaemolyticus]